MPSASRALSATTMVYGLRRSSGVSAIVPFVRFSGCQARRIARPFASTTTWIFGMGPPRNQRRQNLHPRFLAVIARWCARMEVLSILRIVPPCAAQVASISGSHAPVFRHFAKRFQQRVRGRYRSGRSRQGAPDRSTRKRRSAHDGQRGGVHRVARHAGRRPPRERTAAPATSVRGGTLSSRQARLSGRVQTPASLPWRNARPAPARQTMVCRVEG